MKAVVLAAGEGKRMRPVSDVVPKEMIPILGKPFLYYILKQIKDAGIDDVIIVTNPQKQQLMKEELGDGSTMGLKLQYVLQEQQLGPAHALLQAKSLIDTEYFLVQYGDSLADRNIAEALLNELSKTRDTDAVLSIRNVNDPSRYGILKFDGERIVEIVEKPAPGTEPSRMATMGVYIMNTRKFFDSLENKQFTYGKELFPPQYILLSGGSAVGWKFDGKRVDMGKPEDMLKGSLLISSRPIQHVVFDADNTLYSTKTVAKNADMAAMAILAKATGKAPEELYDQFGEIVRAVKDSMDPEKRHRMHSYGRLCDKYGVDYVDEMYEAFRSALLKEIRLVDGVEKILTAGTKKFHVITEDNYEMTVGKLRTLGMVNHFVTITASDTVGTMKPSEKYYEYLLKQHKPEEILVVGDNYGKDLYVPARLGMHVHLVQTPEDLKAVAALV